MKNYIIAAIIALTFASPQGVVNQMDKGSINYSDRTISAIGIGFVPINAVNASVNSIDRNKSNSNSRYSTIGIIDTSFVHLIHNTLW